MENLGIHGKSPFRVVVVHGGPGAGGEMTPVARELAHQHGVLEPIQTATSLKGQVEELRTIIDNHADMPVNLIGFSWGAWLSLIVTATYPKLVKKLILVGSGPFEQHYTEELRAARFNRLTEQEKAEFTRIGQELGNASDEVKNQLFARIGAITAITETYDPISEDSEPLDFRGDIFEKVWPAAAEMRSNGQLLDLAKKVTCPVIAIHGDYDPHPAAGVQKPLAETLENFQFVLLKHCGHKPWVERQARAEFFRRLEFVLR